MKTVTYRRQVHYYETDRMDCVHHTNYIRWFEEARGYYMQKFGFPYEQLEKEGILSPVLTVEAEYKTMARFGDYVLVEVGMESYTGSRAVFCYTVRDEASGAVRCAGKTSHCFLNASGRPVSLKKANPAYDEAFRRVLE